MNRIKLSLTVLTALLAVFLTTRGTYAQTEATVSGRVYNAGSNNPIRRARVILTASGFIGSDMTDENGRYSIDDCPVDHEIELFCRKVGYKPFNTTLPVLTEVTTLTAYTYDIPLSSLIKGFEGIGYDKSDSTEVIYSIQENDKERESKYTPGVEPDELKEKSE